MMFILPEWLLSSPLRLPDGATANDLALDGNVAIAGDTDLSGDLTVDGHSTFNTVNLVADTDPPTAQTEGDMWWSDGVLNQQTPFEDVVLQDGLETQVDIRTESGALSNGQAVYTVGTSGTRRLVAKAQANATATAKVLAVVTHDINDNSNGRATAFGLVRNINTTGTPVSETWEAGDQLYLSPSVAGAFTKVMPAAPNEVTPVGRVGRVHATQGDIYVNIGPSSAIYNGRYVVSSYGEISVADGSATEAITDTPTKLNLFVTNGVSQLMTPDAENDRITVGLDGVYLINFQMSFSFSIGNVIIESHVYVNQAEKAPGFHRKIGTAGDAGSASCVGLLALNAGDQVEIYTNTVSGSGNIAGVDAQLVVTKVG